MTGPGKKYRGRVRREPRLEWKETGRRTKYSAAVINGIKRNATTYVGDSIVRKTDARLSKGEDVVVCLPGARIEHVTERESREDHGKRKGRNHSGSRSGEQRGQGGDNGDCGSVPTMSITQYCANHHPTTSQRRTNYKPTFRQP